MYGLFLRIPDAKQQEGIFVLSKNNYEIFAHTGAITLVLQINFALSETGAGQNFLQADQLLLLL